MRRDAGRPLAHCDGEPLSSAGDSGRQSGYRKTISTSALIRGERCRVLTESRSYDYDPQIFVASEVVECKRIAGAKAFCAREHLRWWLRILARWQADLVAC